MFKKIIVLFVLTNLIHAQTVPHVFSSGQLIDNQEIDNNMRSIESYANDYQLNVVLGDYTSETFIYSNKFNQDVDELNLKLFRNTGNGELAQFSGDIVASEMNTFFSNAIAYVTSLVGESCLDILSKRPGTGDGFYKIKPSASPDAFWTYCDMAGGGWTLLFEIQMASSGTNNGQEIPIDTPSSNPVYVGDNTTVSNITVFTQEGNTTTIPYQDLQKAVKYVQGNLVKFPANVVAKSTNVSTFRDKVINRTSWTTSFTAGESLIVQSLDNGNGGVLCDNSTAYGVTAEGASRIYQPAWDYSYSGTYTGGEMLGGCHSPESYGDRTLFGVAIRTNDLGVIGCGFAQGASGYCGTYYITGKAGHRGGVGYSGYSWATWIR